MIFLSLLSIPALIALGFFLITKKTITWQEFLAHLGVAAVVAGISVIIMYWANTSDVEIWNGHVTKKQKERVSCEHSYSCNCVTTCSGGKNSTCTTICQTCYDHSYDNDWAYYTTDSGRNTISRVDRQGLKEPPRFTKVTVGEPSASAHRFENFIKASPDSLFSKQGLIEKYKGSLPNYPGNVYDYYKINRLVAVGTNLPNAKQWNWLLMRENDRLGSRKEVTMGVVVVKDKPQDYFHALEQHWLGGKKNDLFLVMSVDNELNINWARVMAWTKDKVAQVSVRDAVLNIGDVSDPERIVMAMSKAVEKDFVRKPMKDFEYLASSVTPSVGQWVFAAVLNVLLSIGLGIFLHRNDFTEDSYSYRGLNRFRRRRRW